MNLLLEDGWMTFPKSWFQTSFDDVISERDSWIWSSSKLVCISDKIVIVDQLQPTHFDPGTEWTLPRGYVIKYSNTIFWMTYAVQFLETNRHLWGFD